MSTSAAFDQPPSHIAGPLRAHLASSGLFSGLCADVRLRAFGRIYPCHRLLLIQAGFFKAMLCGDFMEASLQPYGLRSKGAAGKRRTEQGSSRARGHGSKFGGHESMDALSDASMDDPVSADGFIDLHFDDPNITRTAFEYCLATLYGAAPELQLPPWATPTISNPLTANFEGVPTSGTAKADSAPGGEDEEEKSLNVEDSDEPHGGNVRRHPATPRFLLSLLATSTYLIMPAVTSKALTLVLCSITPYTVSHYLRFALGRGILGAPEARQRLEARQTGRRGAEQWDWELEGPVWRLDLGQDELGSTGLHGDQSDDEVSERLEQVKLSRDGLRRSPRMELAGASAAHAAADARDQLSEKDFGKGLTASFNYGATGLKIGDSCVCWLVRWGADLVAAEELEDEKRAAEVEEWINSVGQPGRLSRRAPGSPGSVPLLPRGTLPMAGDSTAPIADAIDALSPPALVVWSHSLLHGLPSAWVRGIISSDSFYIRSEWDRYELARRIVEMRRRQKIRAEAVLELSEAGASSGAHAERLAREESTADEAEEDDVATPPRYAFGLKPFDSGKLTRSASHIKTGAEPSTPRRASNAQQGFGSSPGRQSFLPATTTEDESDDDEDEAEYTRLFAHGIYYTHMTFQDLSTISNHTSPSTDAPYAPLTVLQGALWAGQELKNMILSCRPNGNPAHTRSGSVGPSSSLATGQSEEDDATEDAVADDAADVSTQPSAASARGSATRPLGVPVGIASPLSEFEAVYEMHRSTSAASPMSRSRGNTPAPGSEGGGTPRSAKIALGSCSLGGVGTNPLQLGAAGGPVALLQKRFFPVPLDDTERRGDSLSGVVSKPGGSGAAAAAAAAAQQEREDAAAAQHSGVDGWGPTGLAAAREPHSLPLPTDRYATASSGAQDDFSHLFGMNNEVRTGKELAETSIAARHAAEARAEASGDDDEKESALGRPSVALGEPSPDGLPASHQWTGYEPMRVGVEFWGVHQLAEKQRLYSPTFFYAGSIWNLYVQTIRKPKGLQLGIYLHRQSPSEYLPLPSAPPASAHDPSSGASVFYPSVDEAATSSSAGGPGSSFLPSSAGPRSDMERFSLSLAASPNHAAGGASGAAGAGAGHVNAKGGPLSNGAVSTVMPSLPYRDPRKILRAFFSIHCPSPLGTALTRFSSGPDDFALSQSWGWKSSSLLGTVFLEGPEASLSKARSESATRFRCVCTIGLV